MGAIIGGLLVLAIGWLVGRTTERARRARVDHRKTRTLVAGLRRTAWRETGSAIKAMAGMSAFCLVLFVLAWRGAR